MSLADPLTQFKIFPLVKITLLGVDTSFTNSSLYMLITTLLIVSFLYIGSYKTLPGYGQLIKEYIYNFVADIVKSNSGVKGKRYTAVVLTIFVFILTCNLIGMVPLPMSFTVTSHISVTFLIAFFIFVSCTIIGFIENKSAFLRIFLPSGIPWWLAPIIVVIEVFSYLARPLSLSLRLTANMIAGHTILAVIASLAITNTGGIAKSPLVLLVILMGFEIFIAILQAYIFTILTCVYLNDSLSTYSSD